MESWRDSGDSNPCFTRLPRYHKWACHRSIEIHQRVLCSLGSSKIGSTGPLPAFWGAIELCIEFAIFPGRISRASVYVASPIYHG
eukprot:1145735-Pelagomonas_calceolata.AAC.1